MARQHAIHHVSPRSLPEIKTIEASQPGEWLRAGWEDMKHNPAASIGYGLIIAAAYAAIIALTAASGWYHIGVYLTAGFVLIAPIFAVGLHAMSRRLESDATYSFGDAFRGWASNTNALLGMGLILMLLLLTWFMVSIQVTAVLAHGATEVVLVAGPGGEANVIEYMTALITSMSLPLFLGFFVTGLVAALVAFTFGAVSFQTIMEHEDMDAITALVVSWRAVIGNWKPMLGWAVLIAFISGIGILFAYIGLAVALPLLGHASWHAYRDLVGEAEAGA